MRGTYRKCKVRELLKRVQNNQLQDTVKALRVRSDIDGISYTEAANHLTSAVSELPEYLLARCVSSLKRIRGGGSEKGKNKFKQDSIHADKGTIFTGYYSNWKSLSKEDRDKVIAEWKKKNTNGGVKNDSKRKLAEIQALTDDIAMMKHTVSQLAATKRNQVEQDDDTPVTTRVTSLAAARLRLASDNYPLCLEQYLVLFMQCINSLQRDLVVYRV